MKRTSHRAADRAGPGHRRFMRFLLCLIGCSGLAAGFAPPAALANDVIKVPLRWCAVDGSPAVTDPSAAPGSPPDTDTVLWNRHERAGDKIWKPQAKIAFRSGIIKSVKELANFPIIADPCPPAEATVCASGDRAGFSCTPDGDGEDAAQCGAGVACATTSCPAGCPANCPGELGDIFDFTTDPSERDMLESSCRMAWDDLENELGLPGGSLPGTITLNVRRTVDANGVAVSGAIGNGIPPGVSGTGTSITDICNIPPPTLFSATAGALVLVTDNQLIDDPEDQLLAHEIGHSLWLRHGNGLDDDGNDRYDPDGLGISPNCDPQETGVNAPASLMFPVFSTAATTVTDPQSMTARAVAAVLPGATIDPPAADVPFGVLGDDEPDALFDGPDDLDLDLVALGFNVPVGVASVTHGVRRNFPAPSLRDFLVFADWDDDSTTGGAPADLGFEGCMTGVDLVTQVTVRTATNGNNVAIARAWRFVEDDFVALDAGSLQASVPPYVSLHADPPPVPERSRTVALSIFMAGPPAAVVPLQAVALDGDGNLADRLADEADGVCAVPFRMLPPKFPVCSASPEKVSPGETITVAASGLFEEDTAKVLLGDEMIVMAETDAAGDLSVAATVPEDAASGLRLLTVGTMGTALTADCSVTVLGDCDLDSDGRVDHRDIQRIAASEGREDRYAMAADVDGDGVVTGSDLGHCLLRCEDETCRAPGRR